MKSVETQFAEACDRLRAEKKFRLFNEKRQALKTSAVEPQLNLALAVLSGEVKESTPIRKFNGAADNGTLLTESADSFTEATDPREAQVAGYMLCCNISEAEARKVLGLFPKGLTPSQGTEFMLATACGISESDALILCKK